MKKYLFTLLIATSLLAQTPTPSPIVVPANSILINLQLVLMVVPKPGGIYSVEYDNDYHTEVKGNPLNAPPVSWNGGCWVKMELAPEK